MTKCVIFDFQDTLAQLIVDWKLVLSELSTLYSKYEELDEIVARHKTSPTNMLIETYDKMLEVFPKNKADQIYREASEIMEKHELDGVKKANLMPHVEEVLHYLKNEGLKIGVITCNSNKAVTEVMKNFRILRYVDALFSRESPGKLKPHPDHILACLRAFDSKPEEAILVGDGKRDMEAAKKVGIYAVGVLFKWDELTLQRYTQKELDEWTEDMKKEADIVINDLLELVEIVRERFGG